MSLDDGIPQPLSGSAKVEPKGRINIGHRLTLEEHAPTTMPATGLLFSAGLPEEGQFAPFESPGLSTNPGQLSVQQLEYVLRATDDELYLEDDGLTMSYGIFGAPGSGKTYLMLHLLRQLLALHRDDDDRKMGALILDPKAALIEDVRAMAKAVGRSDDLIVINAEFGESVNVIDCDLKTYELARLLVLAAQSAGVAASEPLWFQFWEDLFKGTIYLLRWLNDDIPTLRDLLHAVLTVDQPNPLRKNDPPQRMIQQLAQKAERQLAALSEDERTRAQIAIGYINRFFSLEARSIEIVLSIISQAYGVFLYPETERFSRNIDRAANPTTFYDQIIDDGKIVLVSVSPAEQGLAKVLSTLIKLLFMQSMRSRLDRVRSHRLRNFERVVLLACDEYSQAASEIPGQVGDGDFFSIARQQGCMGLIATQSVNVLQSSSLKENWKSIFSNFGAKIFMRAVDNETTEEATKLAGETDWFETSRGTSSGAQGFGSSAQRALKERKVLPSHILTQLIETGQGVVIGTLKGGTRPQTCFFHVPEAPVAEID